VTTCSTPAPTRSCLHPRKHRRSTAPCPLGATAAWLWQPLGDSTSAPAISAGGLRSATSFSTKARAPRRLSPMADRDTQRLSLPPNHQRLSLPPESWVECLPQQTAVALAAAGSHGSAPAAEGHRGARCDRTTQNNSVLSPKPVHVCRMDLPGPTTSVGTRTYYSLGPWDYPTCAARHLLAWSTRTTEEKYSVRKVYMSRTVWRTPRRTRLVLSP
jgi:hypothetical protein